MFDTPTRMYVSHILNKYTIYNFKYITMDGWIYSTIFHIVKKKKNKYKFYLTSIIQIFNRIKTLYINIYTFIFSSSYSSRIHLNMVYKKWNIIIYQNLFSSIFQKFLLHYAILCDDDDDDMHKHIINIQKVICGSRYLNLTALRPTTMCVEV